MAITQGIDIKLSFFSICSKVICHFQSYIQIKLFTFQIRQSGASHWDTHMNIIASKWRYLIFKDLVHFYTIIVSAPLLAIVAYANIFVGSSKLAAIPEGYEPEDFEYEPHPITRWASSKSVKRITWL